MNDNYSEAARDEVSFAEMCYAHHDRIARLMHQDGIERECTVYRCYNDSGQLLYVGISILARERVKLHRKQAIWGKLVAGAVYSEPMPRADAVTAVAHAVQNEHPIYVKSKCKRKGKYGIDKPRFVTPKAWFPVPHR